ncbi:ABC transporter permease [Tropicibacter sp. Alg240-R139]|uniref:ABC transporter permease n=1 Tax=Tropicibacter sp. Alg240-R139 TaxID=2305991 RepID=UPI0013DE8B17|nr:ABC transporter permease [Tropicibacter sp. Alg240-R139]
MLIVSLALRDLFRDRFFLMCNTAILVGVLVPLLLLFGVKNGVYAVLLNEMLADPASRQIDTAGNTTFTEADVAPLRDWPGVAFATPKVRSQFDYVNVRSVEGKRLAAALVIPSGTGDPTLPKGAALAQDSLAISAALARQLNLTTGASLQLITQAEDRPRQLVLDARVGFVLPEQALAGRAVLAPFEILDLIEAFYDAYELPDHGIVGTKSLNQRVPSYGGVRVYADSLDNLAPLQARLEDHLGVATLARTREVEGLLGLGRNLTLALGLTAGLASVGLGAALGFAFWSDVARKKGVLASIALVGVTGRKLMFFPVVQAAVTGALGLFISWIGYHLAGRIAQNLFGSGLPEGAALTLIAPSQAIGIGAAVMVLLLCVSAIAGWSVQRIDPATVLREVT